MTSLDLEQQRNSWVSKALGLGPVYRDDNTFIEQQPSHFEEGATVGTIILGEDGREYLVDHNGEGEVAVPTEYYLGLVA